MAVFDVLDFLGIPDFFTWRSFIPTAIWVGAGLGVYYLFGETPASAATCVFLALVGLCVGIFWQLGHKRHS